MVLVIHYSYHPSGRPTFNGRPADQINSDPNSDIQIVRGFRDSGYTHVSEPEVHSDDPTPIQEYIDLCEQNS